MSNKTITLNEDKMKALGELTKDCLAAITKQKVEFATSIGAIDYLIFYIYDMKSDYDYSKFTVKYDDTGNKNEIYYTSEVIKAMVGDTGEYSESTTEKRFIQDILTESECENLYIIDEILCDISGEVTIALDDIDSIYYNKLECELYITCCDEKYKIDVIDGKIFLIDEEEELQQGFNKLELEEKTEIIQNAINNYNKFDDTWCKLFIKNNKIYTKDNENGGEGEICELDNINDVDLDYHDKTLFFSFIKTINEYFDNCKITKDGIEC